MLEKFITFMLIGRDEEKGATATEYGCSSPSSPSRSSSA